MDSPDIPPQVKTVGDHDLARQYYGAAISQLNILTSQLALGNLDIGSRICNMAPGVTIECRKNHSSLTATIYADEDPASQQSSILDTGSEEETPALGWWIRVTTTSGTLTRDTSISFSDTATDASQEISFSLLAESTNIIDATIASVVWKLHTIGGVLVGDTVLSTDNPSVVVTLSAVGGEPPAAKEYGLICEATGTDGMVRSFDFSVTVNPWVSEIPIAHAGPDQSIDLLYYEDGTAYTAVTMDGSLSSDADGTIGQYEWSWFEDSVKQFAYGANPVIDLKGFGPHPINLQVTDDAGRLSVGPTAESGMTVTINDTNEYPVADAGTSQTIFCANAGDLTVDVTLDGSLSTDPNTDDGDTLTYLWEEGATFKANTVSPMLTGVSIGPHTFDLTVTDQRGFTSVASVSVQVLAYNYPPVAIAGDDVSAVVPHTGVTSLVNLDGALSTDQDGSIVKYEWSEALSVINPTTLSNPAVSHAFDAGVHVVDLKVVDNQGKTAADSLIVDIKPVFTLDAWHYHPDGNLTDFWSSEGGASHQAPDITQKVTFYLTAASKYLATGDIITKDIGNIVQSSTWYEVGIPPASDIVIGTTGPDETISIDVFAVNGEPPEATTITVRCESTDSFGQTGSITFTLTANPWVSQQPAAIVTPITKQIAFIPPDGSGVSVVLDGSSSDPMDSGETIDVYEWFIFDGSSTPVGAPSPTNYDFTATGPNPTVTFYSFGTFKCYLRVTDSALRQGFIQDVICSVVEEHNQAPVAVATAASYNLTHNYGPTVTVQTNIYGSSSNDPDPLDQLTYEWRLNSVSDPVFSTEADTTTPALHGGPGAGVNYTVWLKVTDIGGLTSTASFVINVVENANVPPVADAGVDQGYSVPTPSTQKSVTLNGGGSYDSEGGSLSYAWRYGGTVVSNSAIYSIGLTPGVYDYELTVTDPYGGTDTDWVKITIILDPPLNLDIYVAEGDLYLSEHSWSAGYSAVDISQEVVFTLTATSRDVNNPIVSAYWYEEGIPINSGLDVAVSVFAVPGEPPESTTITIRCDVTGSYGKTDSQYFTLIADPFLSLQPVAVVTQVDVDEIYMPLSGIDVTLNGASSYDNDGSITLYEWWIFDGSGASGTVSESNYDVYATGANPTVTFYSFGSHLCLLKVTDNSQRTGFIQSANCAQINDVNTAPIANAGSDQNIQATTSSAVSVGLSGSVTDPDIGDSHTFEWRDGSTTGTLLSTSVSPTLSFPAGIHLLYFKVTDLAGDYDWDSMYVTILAYSPPVADAGVNQSVQYTVSGQGARTTFYGSVSGNSHPIVTWQWWQGSTLKASTQNFLTPYLLPGTYSYTLKVIDSQGTVAYDYVNFTVTFASYWAYTTTTQVETYSTATYFLGGGSFSVNNYPNDCVAGGQSIYCRTPVAPSGYTYAYSKVTVSNIAWNVLCQKSNAYTITIHLEIAAVPGDVTVPAGNLTLPNQIILNQTSRDVELWSDATAIYGLYSHIGGISGGDYGVVDEVYMSYTVDNIDASSGFITLVGRARKMSGQSGVGQVQINTEPGTVTHVATFKKYITS